MFANTMINISHIVLLFVGLRLPWRALLFSTGGAFGCLQVDPPSLTINLRQTGLQSFWGWPPKSRERAMRLPGKPCAYVVSAALAAR